MKKIIMAAFAASLICSTIPAFAAAAAATGLGVDITAAGTKAAEHQAFQAKLTTEEQKTTKTNCDMPDRVLSPVEKAYCADIK